MGIKGGTTLKKTETINGAEGIETLNLKTMWLHDWNEKEYIRIAIIEEDAKGVDGTISFVLVHFANHGKCSALQACLTKEEIDLTIEGLKSAKDKLELINKEEPH